MSFRRDVIVVLLMVAFSGTLEAKDLKKEKGAPVCTVSVDHSGDDSVGTRLALAVRERIKASSLFRLVEKDGQLQILLASLDEGGDDLPLGSASVISIVFLGKPGWPRGGLPAFLTHYVGKLGSQKVSEIADNIVANLDKKTSEAPYPYRDIFCVPPE